MYYECMINICNYIGDSCPVCANDKILVEQRTLTVMPVRRHSLQGGDTRMHELGREGTRRCGGARGLHECVQGVPAMLDGHHTYTSAHRTTSIQNPISLR